MLKYLYNAFQKKEQDLAAGGQWQQSTVGKMKNWYRAKDFLSLPWFNAQIAQVKAKLQSTQTYFQNNIINSPKWQQKYRFYTQWVNGQFQYIESTLQQTEQTLGQNQQQWFP